jgi:hypothetical protein
MKVTQKAEKILEKIAQIQTMERGKISRMKGRNHFNHQTWSGGRNEVRYVPARDLPDLQEAIDGYSQFIDLTQQYADEIIRLSGRERKKRSDRRKTNKR